MKLYPIKLNPRKKNSKRGIPGMFLFVFCSHKFPFFFHLFLFFALAVVCFRWNIIFLWKLLCGGADVAIWALLSIELFPTGQLDFLCPHPPASNDSRK